MQTIAFVTSFWLFHFQINFISFFGIIMFFVKESTKTYFVTKLGCLFELEIFVFIALSKGLISFSKSLSFLSNVFAPTQIIMKIFILFHGYNIWIFSILVFQIFCGSYTVRIPKKILGFDLGLLFSCDVILMIHGWYYYTYHELLQHRNEKI